MSSSVNTTILKARVIANEWLISHLPDRFAAGIPEYDHNLLGWRIPVWLSYPVLEALGPLGELIVDESRTVTTHTAVDEMKDRALKLYEQHREQLLFDSVSSNPL
jgi:hypothetical protein